ncbi:S41 family peptidase [Streptomyces polyrhachis]|uniref:S41 family peptidase n=1 Tax=Streptomyces polyrhachis TaxID=1282885 RepID=A0ABW2GCQ6_9ACTN
MSGLSARVRGALPAAGPRRPRRLRRPRRVRRATALSLALAGVLGLGAAGGSWAEDGRRAMRLLGGGEQGPPRVPYADQGRGQGADGGEPAARELVSRSGDRWSAAYSAGEYEDVRQSLDGRYTGVGLWVVRTRGGRVQITRVQPGAPADRAGIRPGDRLHAIDGADVTGRPVTEVVARLRAAGGAPAAAGSPVTLLVQRPGQGRREYVLHRERLTVEPVTVRRGAGPSVIKVESFTRGSGKRVRQAARGALSREASPGIVLDLRGNAGGLLTEAVGAASAFLDDGVVATYDLRGEQHALYAEPGGDTATPLVVLVDGGTMSAAELLTGALQERGRAIVVGGRTFGKGSVQLPRAMPDGSVAELTVGQYRTPSGRTLEGSGVEPDLLVGRGSDAEAEARKVLGGLGAGA